MKTKNRDLLQVILEGHPFDMKKLPRITLICITHNFSGGIYKVRPPYSQSLPVWAKPEMTLKEIEAIQEKYNALIITIQKNYCIHD